MNLEKWKEICEKWSYIFELEENSITPASVQEGQNIVVSWSGGWDSTALLIYLACMYGTEDHPILAHSTKCDNIYPEQQSHELECMNNLKKKFEEMGLHIMYSESSISLDNYVLFDGKYNHGIYQAPLNIFSPLLYYGYKNTVICFGYVYKDDFWTFKNEAITMAKAMGALCGNTNTQIAFPLNSATKQCIHDFLEELDILKDTWYCETPNEDGTPCGNCGSCTRVLNEVREADEIQKHENKLKELIKESEKGLVKESKKELDKIC